MCLAIPAKLIKIENEMGTIDMAGTRRDVSLLLHDERAAVGADPGQRLRAREAREE